ncbi:MAG: MMPL family transporter, partial [Solirubrobacteraceae bacterium]|nr:MMPL family transporter [Solirubrobacteraceae bacterium]
MAALTRWVLAHRRLVAGAWLLLALAGAASTTRIGDALERRFDAPGREGFEVNREILAATGAGGALTPLVLVAGDGAGAPAAA